MGRPYLRDIQATYREISVTLHEFCRAQYERWVQDLDASAQAKLKLNLLTRSEQDDLVRRPLVWDRPCVRACVYA